jgi:hypothetical protein
MESMRDIVKAMLRAKNDFEPLGQHWITRFRQAHPSLRAGYSKAIDIDRLTCLTPTIINGFLAQILWYIKEYNIPSSRVYNMDKKAFR